ncbi:MAG: hypothetical protein E5X48_11215 [Mesorhizobium sp.]|uniref:hypothetical protein n=1 Tax=Mesorhizobium sp. TaxID=1871066 RepID=UPI0012158EAB|nr:hypothetical protein [Mesorhizobium sp.]TIQ35987.1 MAG: hypothetical protein E5X48_11215 [Mesorhizobium sp.]
MTLGSTPQPADVVAELGLVFPYTFQKSDPRPWWLADLTTASSIVFPTSFANKSAVKVMDTVGPSALGTSHSFAGVNFGLDYTNRILVVYVFAQSKNAGASVPAQVLVSSWTVGGVGPDGGGSYGFFYQSGGTASSIFCGALSAPFIVSGTSGTISFNTGIATRCSVIVVSTPRITNDALGGFTGGFNVGTSVTANNTAVANGILMAGTVRNAAQTITMTGVTKQTEFSHVAGYQCAWGTAYPTSAGAISATASGASSVNEAIESSTWG